MLVECFLAIRKLPVCFNFAIVCTRWPYLMDRVLVIICSYCLPIAYSTSPVIEVVRREEFRDGLGDVLPGENWICKQHAQPQFFVVKLPDLVPLFYLPVHRTCTLPPCSAAQSVRAILLASCRVTQLQHAVHLTVSVLAVASLPQSPHVSEVPRSRNKTQSCWFPHPGSRGVNQKFLSLPPS